MAHMARQLGLIALLATLAACGTIEGAGQDISGAARTVKGWF